jgi:cysteine synthase A
MIAVPDAASIATARALEPLLGRRVGASTGTNVWGALRIAAELHEAGRATSIVTLLCDAGDRYAHTYFDDDWLREVGIDPTPYRDDLQRLLGHAPSR